MKKFYPLCVLLSVIGICGHLLSSCSSNDDGSTPAPESSGNYFAYGDVESKIESVVYTVDETQKVYTFYFSPTQGLIDLEAMLLADDYMTIVTKTPTGLIDLLSNGNQLVYKKIDVSSSTADNIQKATLSLQLTSRTTAKMSLDVATKSGETLQADYNGTCIKTGGEDEEEVTYDITFTSQIFGYYMGSAEGDAGTDSYYIALTDTEWEGGGTQFNLTAEGYALVLNFYGTPGENWKDFPTGDFADSDSNGDRTYNSGYSGILYRDANGKSSLYTLVDPLKIKRDAQGSVTVTGSFFDASYNEHTFIYEGDLPLDNVSLGVSLPQIEEDITVEGYYVTGTYSGDVFENGNGLMEVTIADWKYENREVGGTAVTIAMFAEKFVDPKHEMKLIPGTYTGSNTYERFTWMTPVELQMMGMIFPFGTYGMYNDGSEQGLFAYPSSGDIVIRAGTGNTYTIEFDLTTITGNKLQGSYTGAIELNDQSSDDKDDGSSTLTDDYEFDLDHFQRAELVPMDNIYVQEIGEMSLEDAMAQSDGRRYAFQHIQLGNDHGTYEFTDEYPEGKGVGKLIEGDFMGIDLLVPEGQNDRLIPGTYPIVAHRWPALFQAGVCVPGIMLNYPINGTYIARVMSAIGWGYPNGYYDPEYIVQNGWLNTPTIGVRACIYSGSVTIEKAEGGDNWFKFSVDARDVRKHNITGSWTGPFYINYSDTPVQEGSFKGTASESANAKRNTPVENRPSIRKVKAQLAKQQSFPVSLKPCR